MSGRIAKRFPNISIRGRGYKAVSFLVGQFAFAMVLTLCSFIKKSAQVCWGNILCWFQFEEEQFLFLSLSIFYFEDAFLKKHFLTEKNTPLEDSDTIVIFFLNNSLIFHFFPSGRAELLSHVALASSKSAFQQRNGATEVKCSG